MGGGNDGDEFKQLLKVIYRKKMSTENKLSFWMEGVNVFVSFYSRKERRKKRRRRTRINAINDLVRTNYSYLTVLKP